MLNGGSLPEQKLDRYLARTNADTYTPIDRTDRLLQRLCKEGYLVRTREMDGGEELVEYMVGPRGKMEVGTAGVAGLVREVYGVGNTEEQREDFEARLARSLGIKLPEPREEEEEQNGDVEGEETQRRQSQRRGRTEEEEESEGEDEDEEEEEEEDSD